MARKNLVVIRSKQKKKNLTQLIVTNQKKKNQNKNIENETKLNNVFLLFLFI